MHSIAILVVHTNSLQIQFNNQKTVKQDCGLLPHDFTSISRDKIVRIFQFSLILPEYFFSQTRKNVHIFLDSLSYPPEAGSDFPGSLTGLHTVIHQ